MTGYKKIKMDPVMDTEAIFGGKKNQDKNIRVSIRVSQLPKKMILSSFRITEETDTGDGVYEYNLNSVPNGQLNKTVQRLVIKAILKDTKLPVGMYEVYLYKGMNDTQKWFSFALGGKGKEISNIQRRIMVETAWI